jgi:hypothetical protein
MLLPTGRSRRPIARRQLHRAQPANQIISRYLTPEGGRAYGGCVTWIQTALWGLFGGFAVEGLDLYGAVRRHRCWPWQVSCSREVGAVGYFVAELFRLIIGSGLAWALAESRQITTAFGALTAGIVAALLHPVMGSAVAMLGV